jgi:hypothetical protein
MLLLASVCSAQRALSENPIARATSQIIRRASPLFGFATSAGSVAISTLISRASRSSPQTAQTTPACVLRPQPLVQRHWLG